MIRNAVKGIPISNKEVEKLIVYYIFAKEFGWKKEYVDSLDCIFVDEMIHLMEEIRKKEEQDIKNG